MFLSIRTTYVPATDLGFLLHKNPAKVQSFEQSFGQVHVYYSEATPEGCTAVLVLDVDPVGLVRNRQGPAGMGGLLEAYVNDRPYVASSFLSVAIAQVYGSALSGRSKERAELAELPIPLEAKLAVVPCRGGETFLRELFEPLGYSITARRHMLDERFPEWGLSPYFTVELKTTCRLYELLSHLYVLIPVLDDDKHYWVGEDEVQKLLHHGEGWLEDHPLKDRITRRYLKHQARLVRSALELLMEEEVETDTPAPEVQLEEKIRLHDVRLATVVQVLLDHGARRVVDLGCGEGKLLRLLWDHPQFTEIVGMDVSPRALQIAQQRFQRSRAFDQPDRVRLLHGSLMYRDQRLHGFDAATLIEVIEHLDPPRLAAMERVVFEFAQPKQVVITTPNVEYNVQFADLPQGQFRHSDHRFEWTRHEFQSWCERIAGRYGYRVSLASIGEVDPVLGGPTQMALFQKESGN